MDIRKVGSGNVGATNLLRARGPAIGVTGLVLDAAKGALPVAAVGWLAAGGAELPLWAAPVAALAAVAGHVLTPWLGFRGGKGVATSLGALLVLSPLPTLAAVGLFAAVVAVTRTVSLGSVLAAVALPTAGAVIGGRPWPEQVALVIVALVVLLRHSGNIRRLLRGEESRLGSGNGKGDR